MNNILKSTTNTIIVIIVVLTAVMAVLAMMFPIQDVPGELWGFWGLIIGWATGQKSKKKTFIKEEPIIDEMEKEIMIEEISKLQ